MIEPGRIELDVKCGLTARLTFGRGGHMAHVG